MACPNQNCCNNTTPLPGGCTTCACPPPVTGTSHTCGDWTTAVVDGVLQHTRTSFNLADGVYLNPTITIANGCLVNIAAGTNVITSRPELCTGSTGGGGAASITFDTDPCSLVTTTSGGALSTIVHAQAQVGSTVTVTGCGSSLNPFVIGSTQPVSTYDRVDTCGWNVNNGVIYGMPASVLSAVEPGPGISVTYNGSTCTAVVSLATATQAAMPMVTCTYAAGGAGAYRVWGTPSTLYTFTPIAGGGAAFTATPGTNAYIDTIVNGRFGVFGAYVSGVLIGFVNLQVCPDEVAGP